MLPLHDDLSGPRWLHASSAVARRPSRIIPPSSCEGSLASHVTRAKTASVGTAANSLVPKTPNPASAAPCPCPATVRCHTVGPAPARNSHSCARQGSLLHQPVATLASILEYILLSLNMSKFADPQGESPHAVPVTPLACLSTPRRWLLLRCLYSHGSWAILGVKLPS